MHFSVTDLFVNTFTGLLGIALTLAFERVLRWFRARAIEKRFPVAGTYLTQYSDKGKVYSDVVRLKQSGNKVRGSSILSAENPLNARKWIFEGEVKKEGYLHGTYRPETPFDKGFGAFFCKFGKGGDMHGYWLGKDADESEIQWGVYTFLKQPEFSISTIEPTDKIRVLQIAEMQLGEAFMDESQLRTSDEEIALCVRVHEEVVAFATARIMTTDNFLNRIESCIDPHSCSLRPLQRRLDGETKIGFVASAATDPEFLCRGLAAKLIEHCVMGLELRGANVIAATAWRSKSGIHVGTILNRLGFQKLLEVPNYWEKDSLKNGYDCPECGAPPCHCSAVVFIRNRHPVSMGKKKSQKPR